MKAVLAQSLGAIILVFQIPPWAIATSPYLEDGIKQYNAGHFVDAVGLFGQAQSAEFNNPVLHYYLANALSHINQPKEAIKEYRIAIALQPEGQIADYCQQALRSLGVAPPVASPKSANSPIMSHGPEAPISAAAVPKPQIVGILCGCPLCYRVELILTDLEKKYGDRVTFIRTMRNSSDPTAQFLSQRYNISECPTVLVIDGAGVLSATRTGSVAEADLKRDTEKLLSALPAPSASDERTAAARGAIMQEAQARVATDQRRVDEEIKMIQNETSQRVSDASRYRGYNYHEEIEQIQTEANRTMQSLRNDFDRRKQEVFAAAEAKIQSLSATAGGRTGAR